MNRRLYVPILLVAALFWTGAGVAAARASIKERGAEHSGPNLKGVKTFSTEFSQAVIETGITYNGQQIDLSGNTGGIRADAIILKLTSPEETIKLNVKGRFGPLWMNTRQYEVENVPSIYKVHTSGKIDEIISTELAKELGIGYEMIKGRLNPHKLKGEEEPDDLDTVFKGLVQLKQDEDLYSIDESGKIALQDGGQFSHTFDFPPAAKPGKYQVESYLLRKKKLVGYAKEEILIEKVGLVSFIAEASKAQPVLYGICCVVIALGTGLLVGFIFKGGGHH